MLGIGYIVSEWQGLEYRVEGMGSGFLVPNPKPRSDHKGPESRPLTATRVQRIFLRGGATCRGPQRQGKWGLPKTPKSDI